MTMLTKMLVALFEGLSEQKAHSDSSVRELGEEALSFFQTLLRKRELPVPNETLHYQVKCSFEQVESGDTALKILEPVHPQRGNPGDIVYREVTASYKLEVDCNVYVTISKYAVWDYAAYQLAQNSDLIVTLERFKELIEEFERLGVEDELESAASAFSPEGFDSCVSIESYEKRSVLDRLATI